MKHIFISKQQKRLWPIKRIINFAKEDVNREEYFSRPIKSEPLYLIDYKRSVKIVRALTEQPKNQPLIMKT